MDQFSIKDIENLCGIKAHTLRTWEKRYGLVMPKRNGGSHRSYDNNDLKEMLRISFLYKQGYKISRIAEFSTDEIRNCVECTPLDSRNHEIFVNQLIAAGLDFDKQRFERIIDSLVLCIGLEKCITSVLYPCLQRIGLLWMTNHVIPAQEHFVSNIIRKKIICATDALEKRDDDTGKVMVFGPPGEFHEIPLLVANYLLKKNQKPTVYFGINVLFEDVRYYAKHNPVDDLFLHSVTHFDQSYLDNYVFELCSRFPRKKILLSGPAGTCVKRQLPNLKRICSIEEMVDYARTDHFGIT